MDTFNAIRSRRSIREYTKDIPADKQIDSVLEAARWAPSGLNNQPWRFIVVKDTDLKTKLAACTEYSEIIESAPISICVFLDMGSSYNRDKDVLAIGASIQNMLLCAHAQGLATCWMGEILNQKKQVCKVVDADSDYELMAVVTLGFSDEKVTKSNRKALKGLVKKI
ncbi:nitroreductase family protein [Candidatus Omnitrophota bacterium]